MWTRTVGLPDCSEPGMGMFSPQVRRTSVLRSKTLPGLPKVPSAEKIDVDEDGRITGLF